MTGLELSGWGGGVSCLTKNNNGGEAVVSLVSSTTEANLVTITRQPYCIFRRAKLGNQL